MPRTAADDVAARFDDIVKAALVRDIGSTTMMIHTGRGRRPVHLTTVSNVTGAGETVSLFVNGKPSGVWVWLEAGTGAHREGARVAFMKAQGYPHPVRGPVRHPGSRGKQTWSRAVDDLRRELPELGIDVLRKAIRHG
jgi:hypothetical protein